MLNTAEKTENIVLDQASSKTDGYISILKNKNFLALWLAQVFSQLADRVIFVVFVAFIAHYFSTATKYQSFLYIAFTIPAMLFTALAGVFIDKWNKKHTLIFTNLLRAGFILILPLFSKTLFGIYALAFMVSSVTQFFVPAEASSIPMMVKKNQLMSANSLFTATMMGSLIFGFVLGDPLINIFGLQRVNIAISVLFLISAAFLLLIKYTSAEHENTHHKTLEEFFDEFKEGFNYIKRSPAVFNALLKLAGLFSIIVMLCILTISLSQQILYPENPALGAQKFAYVIACSGVGMILGSVLVGRFLKTANKLLTIFTGFIIIGVSLLMLSAVAFVPCKIIYSYISAGIVGIGCAMAAVPIQTILHSLVPEKIRGKIFGIQFTLLSTSSTLPIIIAAYAADALGVTTVLLLVGLIITVFGIWGMTKVKK